MKVVITIQIDQPSESAAPQASAALTVEPVVQVIQENGGTGLQPVAPPPGSQPVAEAPAGVEVIDEGPQPANPPAEKLAIARKMLIDAGEKTPESLLGTFSAERIIEVCIMAARKKDKLKNVPGYINAALRRGWRK